MERIEGQRILVTGGGTFLGDHIAEALLAAGAEVSLMVRPGAEDRLGTLASRVRWFHADVWTPASLRGRGRGHAAVIHTVGGMKADPARGLTHHYLNLVSARNVATMCVSSAIPHLIFMSSARAPWIDGQYLSVKREAESYLMRLGLRVTIIRAPLLYARGARRNPFFQIISLLSVVPPLGWLGLSRVAPMAIDVAARGIARVAIEGVTRPILYATDLRRRARRSALRSGAGGATLLNDDTQPRPPLRGRRTDADVPFGWTPTDDLPRDGRP